MIQSILYLIISLILVIGGSNYLIEGGASVAKRCGISEFIIGAIIIGFGTSCPELVVSMTGAIEGNSDIAIGNIVGSNIFNVAFILGITAIIRPIPVTGGNKDFDIRYLMSATIILLMSLVLIGDMVLTRVEGVIFIFLFGLYVFVLFRSNGDSEDGEDVTKVYPIWLTVVFIVGGLASLIIGGRLFVDSAVDIARLIGVSDKMIAMTILAMGTSLPEACTCIMSALKGRSQMALGDIIGSNIFNILLVLGASSLISPLSFVSSTPLDFAALLLSVLVLRLCDEEIGEWEGMDLLLLFFGYYGWLIFC